MRRLFVLPVMLYRILLSPFVGRFCRFRPTCSEYAYRAILVHGAWKGTALGLARICRCHPFGRTGFDPVPGDPLPRAVEGRAEG